MISETIKYDFGGLDLNSEVWKLRFRRPEIMISEVWILIKKVGDYDFESLKL